MNDKEKKYKNAKETLDITNKIIDYKNNAPIFFHCGSKVDKKNHNQRLKNVLQREQS